MNDTHILVLAIIIIFAILCLIYRNLSFSESYAEMMRERDRIDNEIMQKKNRVTKQFCRLFDQINEHNKVRVLEGKRSWSPLLWDNILGDESIGSKCQLFDKETKESFVASETVYKTNDQEEESIYKRILSYV
ncbi:hypothetical protein SNEBB_008639 [Seison nebaliae]|nr:hypothetical protein SNEBB_008639 [Seison nebaliae]